jgi:hypothetical protein
LADIRSILKCEPFACEIRGFQVKLKRPTVADLLDVLDISAKDPNLVKPWTLHRHLLDGDGVPIFPTVEDARLCPAHFGAEACAAIESLYNEGRD